MEVYLSVSEETLKNLWVGISKLIGMSDVVVGA